MNFGSCGTIHGARIANSTITIMMIPAADRRSVAPQRRQPATLAFLLRFLPRPPQHLNALNEEC